MRKRTNTKIQDLNFLKSIKKLEHANVQSSLKNFLTVGACLCMMPVDGLRGEAENLKFSWFSLKTIYVLSTIILSFANLTIMVSQSIIDNEGFLSYGK